MDDFDFAPIDYSIDTPIDFGNSFEPESIYDLYDGSQTLGSYAPSIDAPPEDWLNYFQDQSGTNGWDINTTPNQNWFQQLIGGGNLFNTLGQLGSAALVGRNIYESNQTNQLNQEMLRAQIEAAKAKLIQDSKLADSATYSKYTNDASAHTTSARDNALLRHYLEQTQPYNRERELAILGQNGVDIGGLQALRNSQIPKQNDYVKDLLGYENRFNSYADDMINMRNQDQLYNSLNPNIGGQTGQSFDWQSTIPNDADPALIEDYLRYIGEQTGQLLQNNDTGSRPPLNSDVSLWDNEDIDANWGTPLGDVGFWDNENRNDPNSGFISKTGLA